MNAPTDCLLPHHHDREEAARPADDSAPDSHPTVNQPPTHPPRPRRLLTIVAVIFLVGLVLGLVPRLLQRQMVSSDTHELSEPNVAVVSPELAKPAAPLLLSGELKPMIEASIHARVHGYVRRWLVDLGAKVEAGQLLAELDTPDTDRELDPGACPTRAGRGRA